MNEDPGLASANIEDLFRISEKNSHLEGILERSSICEIDEWREKSALRKKQRLEERKTRQTRNIENLKQHKAVIESGKALGILDHYARVWFDLFTDINHEATPMERLEQETSPELAESITQGFCKALDKPVFNTIEDIAKTAAKNSGYNRGYVMLAAMDIFAEAGKKDVLSLSDEVLRLALAYEMANAVKTTHEWPNWVISNKHQLAADVLNEYWHTQIATGAEHISRFYAFNGDEPQIPIIEEVLLKLLRELPKAHPQVLKAMLQNAIKFCPFETLAPLVTNALTKHFPTQSGQRAMWIAFGFKINQVVYLEPLKKQLRLNEQNKWEVSNILFADIMKRGEDGKLISSNQYRKLVVELLGTVFKNVDFERTEMVRSIGSHDEPTAANDIRSLIHTFSQDPSDEAARAIAELENNPVLTHWHSDIIFTMANQVRTAREAKFTYPDVSHVVSTLSNAEPANVADLKALVMDALKDIANEIRHGNTDGYKSFWNIGDYSKPTDKHIDENTARDRLLEFLRPKLRHLDIAAEPEVRYADDKRADIAIYSAGMKLPIEIKRDDHPAIWTAAENQLNEQYSRDPASEGHGIYLVFWFDGIKMALPPKAIKKPMNAEELKKALQLTIKPTSSGLIDVIVIDASVPEDKKAKAKKTKSVVSKPKK